MAFPGLLAVSAVRWIVRALKLLHGLHLVRVIREHLQSCRHLLHLTSFQMPIVTWPCCLPSRFSETQAYETVQLRAGVQLAKCVSMVKTLNKIPWWNKWKLQQLPYQEQYRKRHNVACWQSLHSLSLFSSMKAHASHDNVGTAKVRHAWWDFGMMRSNK